MIQFTTSDNKLFEVDEETAKMSALVKNMMDDGLDCDTPLKLNDITYDVLQKIMEYCEYHKNDIVEDTSEIPINEKMTVVEKEYFIKINTYRSQKRLQIVRNLNDRDCIDDWDAQYMNYGDIYPVLDIMKAANFLDIENLIVLCAKVAATFVNDMDIEKIKEIFDLSAE